MGIQNSDVTVVMVPLPAQGHLNQLLHLSRLISSHNIPVHYVCTPAHTRQAKSRVHGWDPTSTVNFHEFPVPPYETPPPNPNAPTRFPAQLVPAFFASTHLREPIFQLVQKLAASAKRLVVIHDSLMPYVIQDIHTLPNAESYAFQSISAFSVLSYVWEGAGKPDLPESPLFQNLPETVTSEEFQKFIELHFVETNVVSSGNLFNSCRAIEAPFLDRLANFKMSGSDKNWAVGPFNPVILNEAPEKKKNRHACLDWLDKQQPDSVMFMSFGSTTSVTDEDIKEIAIGLEKSEQRFIWVVRDADKGDVFAEGEVRKSNLPEGFETRIQGRGVVIRDWAPQLEILGHPSTGGFLSHCGWNSCMESISHGVPIAAWPMHSDQPRNSLLITEVLKIGVRVGDLSVGDELVTAESVANVVRRLMDSAEGDEIRQRAKELSRAVKDSIMQGASRLEMDSFVAHIRR